MTSNLLHALPKAQEAECFEDILKAPGCRIERIVSFGQTSPPGFWYDQDWDEWVLVLSGEAALELADRPEPVPLRAGDHLLIPAGLRHRVAFTAPNAPTVWLAIHLGEPPSNPAADAKTNP